MNKNQGRLSNNYDSEELYNLYLSGVSVPSIAKAIGVSGPSVYLMFKREGFTLRSQQATRKLNGTVGNAHIKDWSQHGQRIRAGMLATYGVANPSQLPDFKQKLAKRKVTWLKKYGYESAAQSPQIKRKILARLSRSGMNGLERKVFDLCPPGSVEFCSGKIFVTGLHGRVKSPDFRVIGTRRVIEVNGVFAHSPKMTGQSREEHTRWMQQFYRAAGFTCLVVWSDDIDCSRIVNFCKR